ncbi:MAG: OmpA family protein, partial [Bacteroidota bacterium]
MKKQIQITLSCLLFFSTFITGQNVILEGYVFEDNNRGFLNEVEVDIYNAADDSFVTKSMSDLTGLFTAKLPNDQDYILKISKDLFFPKEEIVSTKGKSTGEKVYTKIKMERKPGYIFDVTLAESGAPTATVDAISGARIEVFNNTKMEETLVIDSLNGINFDVTFERGNHYTVLIRKDGYFNKRLEAYVDVEGCILCFEGVGTVTPGVSDVMSEGFQMGSVLANIELEPARLNRTIEVENIYYDLDKYYIRDDAAVELNKVVTLLKDNPSIILELGSHTDSRGGTRYNKQLSSKRAQAAVEYIIAKGSISPTRISSKGYGESELVNDCTDGKKCSEAQHQDNRRTELKVIGFERDEVMEARSLADMITEEKLLREVLNSEQIQVKPGEVPDFDKLEQKGKSKASSSAQSSTNRAASSNLVKTEPVVKGKPVVDKRTSSYSTQIASASEKSGTINVGETLVSGRGETVIKPTKMPNASTFPTKTNRLNFDASQVMVVQNGQIELVEKMLGNQLNKDITDLLLGQKVYLQKGADLMTYKFDAIDQMPMDLLNVFLKKLAMLKKADGWQLFPVEKGEMLPQAVQDALK